MTKTTLFFSSLLLSLLTFKVTQAQTINFPDIHFQNVVFALPGIDTSGDGLVQVSEANAYTGEINAESKGISDLTGIEHFINITKLNCNRNNLTSLDLSSNTKLKELSCTDNQLPNLILTNNLDLEILDCRATTLTSLDVSLNVKLTKLVCGINRITSIDVTNNTALTHLDVNNNRLTGIDVTKNTALTYLDTGNNLTFNTPLDVTKNTNLITLSCYKNNLTSIDISKNVVLDYFGGHQNNLTSLDTSQNLALRTLSTSTNPITSLDLTLNTNLDYVYSDNNNLTEINVANGQNTNLLRLFLNGNPNLTCINIDPGFTPPNNGLWRKDAQATYNSNCQTVLASDSFNAHNFSLYPNPAKNNLNIVFRSGKKADKISIIDMTGKTLIVQHTNNENMQIDTSRLKAGVYLLVVDNNIPRKILIE